MSYKTSVQFQEEDYDDRRCVHIPHRNIIFKKIKIPNRLIFKHLRF